jgi:hypothetical protein
MTRFDLPDFEWSAIAPLLPNKVRGAERASGTAFGLLFQRLIMATSK